MMRDILARARYKGAHLLPHARIALMENLRTSLLSLVALVVALGLIGGSLVFAPHLTVLAATVASLSYIAGMVFMTVGR